MTYYVLIDDYERYLNILKEAYKMPNSRYLKFLSFQKLEDKINCLVAYLLIVRYYKENGLLCDIDFSVTKPIDKTSKIHFNISHDIGIVAVGFSDVLIGVDVEKVAKPQESLINYTFNKQDLDTHGEISDDFFTKVWTMKESYVKFIGNGLPSNFGDFSFDYTKFNLKYEGVDIRTFKINDFYLSVSCKKRVILKKISIQELIGGQYV